MDILISPIATLTAHPPVLIALLLVILLCYAFPAYLSKRSDKKWVQKLAGLENRDELSDEELGNRFTNIFTAALAAGILAFFVGIGAGEGMGLKNKILHNKLDYSYKLNYGTGDSEQIYLIGSNSAYHIYLAKGNKNLKIAPVGAVKSLELTNNTKLK